MNGIPMAGVTASPLQSEAREKPGMRSGLGWLSFFGVLAILFVGWQSRNEYLINAEYGLGYGLGLTGGIMMLALLIYPVRKRFQSSRLLILSTPAWFRLHMILGILGPLLILYHCNFSLGSTNSNIALFSMLLMVSSGLVGRYIYSKIHYGLYGNRVQMQTLSAAIHNSGDRIKGQQQLASGLHLDQSTLNWLQSLEHSLQKHRGLTGSFINANLLFIKTRLNGIGLKARLRRAQLQNPEFIRLSRREKRKKIKAAHDELALYLQSVRKVAELSFYERLFSLWHMLHLPIFFMLIISGLAHVYAVHVY